MGHLEDLEEMLLLLRDSVEKLLKNPTETCTVPAQQNYLLKPRY